MDFQRSLRRWTSGPIPLVAMGLVLIGALFRFYALAKQPLWYDELISMGMAVHERGLAGIWKSHYYPHPPLFVGLLHLLLKVATPTAFSVRLLSAFAGVLSLSLFYRFVTSAANRWIALGGMLLLTFSPFHIYFSQETRPYALMFCMVLITIWVLFKALGSKGMRWWTIHFLCLLALLYLHFFNWAVVGGEILFMLAYWRKYRDRLLPFALSLLAVPLSLPPLMNLVRDSRSAGQIMVLNMIPETISFTSTWMTLTAGETRYVTPGIRLFGTLVYALLALIGAVRLWRCHRKLSVLSACMIAVPFVFVFVVLRALGQIVPPYEEKMFMVILPFALILAGGGVESLLRATKTNPLRIAGAALTTVFLLVLLGGNLLALKAYYTGFEKNADMHVIRYLESQVQTDDIIVYDNLSLAVNTNYHWNSDVPVEFVARPIQQDGEWLFSGELRPLPALPEDAIRWTISLDDVLAHRRVWLVAQAGFGTSELTSIILDSNPPSAIQEFGPFAVYLIVP